MSVNISRRWFIGGAASFGAFGGCRFFSGSGFASGTPNVKFGVVSDIHISCHSKPGDLETAANNELTFVRTLEWFRDQGVDAVVVAGDMADRGTIDELMMVAEAWNRVFPGDRAPDGRKVERLFVYGNHDMGGIPYARGSFKDLSEEEIAKKIIYTDPKAAWENVFHEGFERHTIWISETTPNLILGAPDAKPEPVNMRQPPRAPNEAMPPMNHRRENPAAGTAAPAALTGTFRVFLFMQRIIP